MSARAVYAAGKWTGQRDRQQTDGQTDRHTDRWMDSSIAYCLQPPTVQQGT